MTDDANYQPLPMPHGHVRPAPPAVLIQEGTLPTDLIEQARGRHDEAEVLMLPREAEARLQDGDPSLAIYNDSDAVAVEVLRRGGVRADYLTEHRKVVAQFAAAEWIEFAILVSADITSRTVVALTRYLLGRIRRARQEGSQPQLDLILGKPDKTFLRATGTDTEALLEAFYTGLAASVAAPRKSLIGKLTAKWREKTRRWKTQLETGSAKNRDFPYRGWKPLAYWIKVKLQMIVGAAAVLLLIARTFFGQEHTLLHAADVIRLVGDALATAAAIELAYTLFTPGPDEALDPLMLGLSAALLVAFASPDKFNYQDGIAGLLLIIGLGVLYMIRRSLDRTETAQAKSDKEAE